MFPLLHPSAPLGGQPARATPQRAAARAGEALREGRERQHRGPLAGLVCVFHWDSDGWVMAWEEAEGWRRLEIWEVGEARWVKYG